MSGGGRAAPSIDQVWLGNSVVGGKSGRRGRDEVTVKIQCRGSPQGGEGGGLTETLG